MANHADRALAARRVQDVIRIRLDGAEFWDLLEFVREQEQEEGSAWFVSESGSPLSEGMIRKYQEKADDAIGATVQKSRKKLIGRHLAQRRHLYGKAVLAGDLRTALACIQDEAKLVGLYPSEKKPPADPNALPPITIMIVPPPVPRHVSALEPPSPAAVRGDVDG